MNLNSKILSIFNNDKNFKYVKKMFDYHSKSANL